MAQWGHSHASRCAQATHEHRQQMPDPSPNHNLPSPLCRTRQQHARHHGRSGPGICLSGGRRSASRRLLLTFSGLLTGAGFSATPIRIAGNDGHGLTDRGTHTPSVPLCRARGGMV